MHKPSWIDSIIPVLTELGLSKVQNAVQAVSDSIKKGLSAWVFMNIVLQTVVSALCFSGIGLVSLVTTYFLAPLPDIRTHEILIYIFSGLFIVFLLVLGRIYQKLTAGPSRSIEASLAVTSRQVELAVLRYQEKARSQKVRDSAEQRIENLEKSIELIAQAISETNAQSNGARNNGKTL